MSQFYREADDGFNFPAPECRCAAHLYGSANEHPGRRPVYSSGCKWRQLPADYPPRSAVYAYFQRTAQNGALAEYHDRLRDQVRESEGRAADPTAAIIDSQSVPAAETVSASHRGYDAGKNIDGRYLELAREWIV